MKKNVLSLIVCALGFSTIGAFAQSEQPQKTPEQKETQCCKEKKEKGDRNLGKDFKKSHGPRLNPFEGIELTADQQAKIDELRATQRSQHEADKAKAKEARKAQREDYNTKLAQILTPEQMAQYRANCDNLKAKKHHKGAHDRADKRKHKAN